MNSPPLLTAPRGVEMVNTGRVSRRRTEPSQSRAWWVTAVLALCLAGLRVLFAGTGEGIDSFRYLNAARAILEEGAFDVERYPPGFPLLIAAADLIGLPIWTTTTAAGLALVVLVWWAAVHMGGPAAGIAAGLFCLLSGLIGEAGVLLMSDTPAAVLLVGALVASLHGRWALAGALMALSAWVRLPHALFILAAGVHRRMAFAMVAGLVPLATFNVVVFGSLSTYRSDQAAWSLSYLGQGLYLDNTATPYGNGYYYSAVLGGAWRLLVPLLPVAAGVEIWHRRSEQAARFATGVVVLNTATYAVYFYQSARFVLPAAAMIIVYAAAWISRMVEDLRCTWEERSEQGNQHPSAQPNV